MDGQETQQKGVAGGRMRSLVLDPRVAEACSIYKWSYAYTAGVKAQLCKVICVGDRDV